MQEETGFHSRKVSKSALFIMYIIGEGGHLEETPAPTLSS